MDGTVAILDGGQLNYSHSQSGRLSSNSEEMHHSRHSLSTLPEVNSVGSDHVRDHTSGSAVYDPHAIDDDEEDYADEIEITDGDPPYSNYGYMAQHGTTDPRIPGRTPRSRVQRDVYERRPPQYEYNTLTYVNSRSADQSRSHKKSRQRGTGLWDQETLSLLPNVAYDYWTLPRSRDLFRRNFDQGETRYQTPSGMLHSRKSHSHRSSKRSHKIRSTKVQKLTDLTSQEHEHNEKQNDEEIQQKQEENVETKTDDQNQRSELKVSWCFNLF